MLDKASAVEARNLRREQELDAREKALSTAERTIAARSRAEQRQALRDARTTLGSDVTSPVDWRAAVFDDKEIWLASEADFLRGVDCKLLKLTLETVATTAKCSYAEAFDACRRAPQDTLATLSASLTDDVRAMARIVDRAVDRLRASSATLAAAASAAEREVADRRALRPGRQATGQPRRRLLGDASAAARHQGLRAPLKIKLIYVTTR